MSDKQNRYNQKQNIVAPAPAKQLPTVARPMSEAESQILQGLTTLPQSPPIQIPSLPQATHTGHLSETFDVRAMAGVAERFILWDMGIFALISAAITVLLWYFIDGNLILYGVGWLVVWGSVSYFAMHKNRGQAYDHSPAGAARLEQRTQATMHERSAQVQEYEIDSRERIALHAIDRHADLIEKRWQLGDGDK